MLRQKLKLSYILKDGLDWLGFYCVFNYFPFYLRIVLALFVFETP